MTELNKQKSIKSPRSAYMGYLFQTFLKRPFGYIIAVLYIVYLAIILLIVPAALHFEPLFIWNVGGFNMPIFNLFFIAASAASIAVAVFRTGRDDGSDLNLSAKPITKTTAVTMKTLVYLIIMLVICIIITGIVAIIQPVFGTYNEVTNITGITAKKYTGLLLSIFIGNIVNMLLFGGIAVFISMVGGQVITIIGTIAIVFVICLMNFLYPQMISSATDILSDKYDTEILSYSCNTLHQYNHPNEDLTPFNFATIQCISDEEGKEEYHYDTREFWDRACNESGRLTANYIDFGKQLSMLYSAFGLEESRLQEASKLMIGGNNGYTYTINSSTHIADSSNVTNENYPISYYYVKESQGKTFPCEVMIGSNMTLDTANWYLLSTLWQVDFNSVNYVSSQPTEMILNDSLRSKYVKPWNKLKDLVMTDAQKELASQLYDAALAEYKDPTNPVLFSQAAYNQLITIPPGVFFDSGTYQTLSSPDKFMVASKIHLYWSIIAQQKQRESIEQQNTQAVFPFDSKDVLDWADAQAGQGKPFAYDQSFNQSIFDSGIDIEGDASAYSKLVTSKISYAETFANLYQYSVHNFYKVTIIIAIWTVIAGVLFAGSIIVYKKTDFK